MKASTNNVWKKVGSKQVEDFQKILKVLVRFHDAVLSEGEKSQSHEFRKRLSEMVVMERTRKVQIYLRKFGKYEYLVYADMNGETESWLHVDGIAEEREQLKGKDHPVHTIVCMSDIYKKARVNKTAEKKLVA